MKIHNVRLGFATNSSSSHSIVWLNDVSNVSDDYYPGEFGWDFFTLASRKSKSSYLASLLKNQLYRTVGEQFATQIAAEMFEVDEDAVGSVDHQSVWGFPVEWFGNKPDVKFIREFREYFCQDGIVVLGGNDNTDMVHDLLALSSGHVDLSYSGSNRVTRKDSKYGHWSLFSRKTGAKIRFSMEKDAPEPSKSYAPELVDVKITDQCPFVTAPCAKYCYQASGPEGTHASIVRIESIAKALADLKVFEVALGGGETTAHPQFAEILGIFRSYGIVPNFTTRNPQALANPKIRKAVDEHAGRFAVSVNTASDVQRLREVCEKVDMKPSRMNVQYVMGSTSEEDFNAMFEETQKGEWADRFSVTLLGYKTTGKGLSFERQEMSESALRRILKDHYRISIDTVLADQLRPLLQELGVSNVLYHTKEGAFSAYIDAVKNQFGPSSFCAKDEMRPLSETTSSDEIVELFAKF